MLIVLRISAVAFKLEFINNLISSMVLLALPVRELLRIWCLLQRQKLRGQ